jgi:hypothetical protein
VELDPPSCNYKKTFNASVFTIFARIAQAKIATFMSFFISSVCFIFFLNLTRADLASRREGNQRLGGHQKLSWR